MRLILLSLPVVLVLACSSSEDTVDSDNPSFTEGDAGEAEADDDEPDVSNDDDATAEPEPAPEPNAADDDTGASPVEPEGVPNVDVPVPAGSGGESTGPVEEPEANPGTGGGGASANPEPEVSMGGDGSVGGADPGECPRPIESYALLGDECDLADFDCQEYYRDECGCGCDDVQQCRPDDAYLATGSDCNIAAVSCPAGEDYFEDDCGCGCESKREPVCTEPAENYVLDDPATCFVALYQCDAGEEAFFDDCGCGCRPVSGSDSCNGGDGSAVEIPPEAISSFSCYGYPGEARVIANADQLQELLADCDGAPPQSLDFENATIFAAIVSERTTVSLAYVTDDGESFHVGVEAEAYCGGARPPTTVMLIQIESPDAIVVQERCADLGMCDPDLLPP